MNIKDDLKNFHPTQFLETGYEIITLWVSRMIMFSLYLRHTVPFRHIYLWSMVADMKGQKMSKSLGNVIYAKDALDKYGADAIRFYYMWDIAPYSLQLFNKEVIKKEVWKIFNVLINLNTYLVNLTDKIKKVKINEEEDKWLLSRLNTTIKEYSEDIEKFEYHMATRKLADFILNNLSREYIHMIRGRTNHKDGAVAYVIYEALSKILSLLAPITPHLAEDQYLKLREKYNLKEESIHLMDWPKEDKRLIKKDLEEKFDIAKSIIQEILSQRENISLGVRWPLRKVTIQTSDKKIEDAVKKLDSIIKTQTNVKAVETKKTKDKLVIILDKTITKELEMEGYSREIMRRIQALRKKAGLKQEDEIELRINSDYDLSKFKKEIMEKVGAKILEFSMTKENYMYSSKEKIKDNIFTIVFDKL